MDRLASMAVFAKVAESPPPRRRRRRGPARGPPNAAGAAGGEGVGVRLGQPPPPRAAPGVGRTNLRESCRQIVEGGEEGGEEGGRRAAGPGGRRGSTPPSSFGSLFSPPLFPVPTPHPRLWISLSPETPPLALLARRAEGGRRIGARRDRAARSRAIAPPPARSVPPAPSLQARPAPLHPAALASANSPRSTSRAGREGRGPGRHGARAARRPRGNPAPNNGAPLPAARLGGPGVVLPPVFFFAHTLSSGRLVHLLADWRTPEFPIQAVWPPQRHPSPKLRAFVDFLADRLARRCPGPAQRAGVEAAL